MIRAIPNLSSLPPRPRVGLSWVCQAWWETRRSGMQAVSASAGPWSCSWAGIFLGMLRGSLICPLLFFCPAQGTTLAYKSAQNGVGNSRKGSSKKENRHSGRIQTWGVRPWNRGKKEERSFEEITRREKIAPTQQGQIGDKGDLDSGLQDVILSFLLQLISLGYN